MEESGDVGSEAFVAAVAQFRQRSGERGKDRQWKRLTQQGDASGQEPLGVGVVKGERRLAENLNHFCRARQHLCLKVFAPRTQKVVQHNTRASGNVFFTGLEQSNNCRHQKLGARAGHNVGCSTGLSREGDQSTDGFSLNIDLFGLCHLYQTLARLNDLAATCFFQCWEGEWARGSLGAVVGGDFASALVVDVFEIDTAPTPALELDEYLLLLRTGALEQTDLKVAHTAGAIRDACELVFRAVDLVVDIARGEAFFQGRHELLCRGGGVKRAVWLDIRRSSGERNCTGVHNMQGEW